MENKFLKRETKVFAVTTSVLIGIALMVLVIIGLVAGTFLNISIIGSSVIVFASGIFMGSMQIRVFSDYKSQKKYLCADGIFYICLTILVLMAALVYVFVPESEFDLRYFIFVFALAFAVWKIIIAVLGFKNKNFNAFAELIIATFWLLSGIGVLLTTFDSFVNVGSYIMCVSNYLLGIATIFYILFSYIFKEPNFLITEQAKLILEQEQQEKAARLNRFNARFDGGQVQPQNVTNKDDSLEDKIAKLNSLKEKGFISEEEYEKRKQALLDKEL